MKEYKSNITKGFCVQWSKSKAIQEYTSNMIDEGNYSFEFGEDYVEFTNHDVKVSHKALLLGLSDKVGDDSKIGQHGAGIPQSMAALLSQGVDIIIYNADVIWEPVFEFDDAWGEEVLLITESHNPTENTQDYKVVISNLTEEDIDEIKQRCLIFQDRETLHTTDIGDIISSNEGETGEIFVGSVYVTQNPDFKHSYNFNIGEVELTQDRNAIDHWKLRTLTARLIASIEDVGFVEEAIKANTYDTALVHDHYWTKKNSSESAHAAVDSLGEEFVSDNEGCMVTSCYSTHQENNDLGNKTIYIDNEVQVKSIQQSSAYKESISNIEMIEKQSPSEVVEETSETIMDILYESLNAEDASKVETLLDGLLEKSGHWGNY